MSTKNIENIADISVSPIFSVQKYRYRIDFEKVVSTHL